MKKRISVVLVLLGCAWALVGCGPKETETSKAETTAATTVAETTTSSESKAQDAGASIVVQESEIVIKIDPSDLENGQSQVISQTIEVKAGDL